jgi:hypothetical protein
MRLRLLVPTEDCGPSWPNGLFAVAAVEYYGCGPP